ncbi:hypothetical protein ACIBSS_31985 [Micromonospora aurantiaca]|uniref:hypothetical protein n=1 Tax=Micromonospora aurantiaca (nom. illeg.) TaxID=47850 RepID=UPI000828A782|nr:hypothetical protein [Micromonospora aurantiaca]SCL43693.1 hypothetical protein GA0070615_6734 [Micromonospora aurantiaca]SCL43720.1 hypothetical protein GA0070615_6761 [Micromonospora aurantiaca]
MHTTPDPDRPRLALLDTDTTTTGRRRLAAWWRTSRTARAVREGWPIAVAALIALAVAGGLLWLLWIVIAGLLSGLGAAAAAVGDAAPALGAWITDGPITRSISDPVRAYLDAHTTGLPADGRDAWITWLVAVCALYAAAVTGSTYGRIGWAAIGVLTGVAVYAGAPAGTGPAAAGLTAVVWLTLSLLAYAGPLGGGAVAAMVAELTEPRRRPTTPAGDAS